MSDNTKHGPDDPDAVAAIEAVRAEAVELTELIDLVQAAAIAAVRDPTPNHGVQLARLDYLAQRPGGAADIYAMFMSWISSWKEMAASVAPDLDPSDHWELAQTHLALPENGADPHAVRLVADFLLRALGVDSDEESADDDFEFFYRSIFLGGADIQRGCALALLFMVKCAYSLKVASARPGSESPPQA